MKPTPSSCSNGSQSNGKRCTKCKCVKPVGDFAARKRALDGKASWCRQCFKDNWRARYTLITIIILRHIVEVETTCGGRRLKRFMNT